MSLADMIAKQRASAESRAAGERIAGPTSGGQTHESQTKQAEKQPTSEPTSVTPAKPASPLKFTLGKPAAKPAQPQESSNDGLTGAVHSQAGDHAGSPVVPDSSGGDLVAGDGGGLTLADIGDSTLEGLDNSDRGKYAFEDEIPATAPARELPEELDESMKSFVGQLDSIYEVVHDPELFGQMIRTIMQELQENPDYTKLMADQDVHTMIRGLRQSMGLAKVKKAEKASKRTASSRKAPAAPAMLNSLEEMFNSEDW